MLGIQIERPRIIEPAGLPTLVATGIRTPVFDGERWTVEIFEVRPCLRGGTEVVTIGRYRLTTENLARAALTATKPLRKFATWWSLVGH